MFEKYSEAARRSVFFARFEASRSGSAEIEVEHLLLGILRIDSAMAMRLLGSPDKLDAIRDRIEKDLPPVEKRVSTSGDLPVSRACRNAMALAAEESERLQHKDIGPDHLLLGIARKESSLAARTLRENGLDLAKLREQVQSWRLEHVTAAPRVESTPILMEDSRDLTASAELNPLIGCEQELERVLGVLARRTRNNPALIGEHGVGKTAIVQGLARRIREGPVPECLQNARILSIDIASLIAPRQRAVLATIGDYARVILCVEGLFDLGEHPGWSAAEAAHVLEPYLARSDIQCLATGTPSGLRRTMEKAATLTRHFEVVDVAPPDDEQAIRILTAVKEQYEKFHHVVFAQGTLETAVYASGRFLFDRFLPERAIDLIDEAGVRARLSTASEPAEIREIRGRIKTLIRRMEDAIGRHEFAKVREYSDQEHKEREKLQQLQEAQKPEESAGRAVTPDDILRVLAERTGMPLAEVKAVLEQNTMGRWERITKRLMAALPAGSHAWAPFLAAYLTRCSAQEAEMLVQAIREAPE